MIDKHNIYKWLTFRHVYLITNNCIICATHHLWQGNSVAFTSVNVASVLVGYLKSVSLKSLYGFTPIVLEMQIMHINYSQWAVVAWRHDWSKMCFSRSYTKQQIKRAYIQKCRYLTFDGETTQTTALQRAFVSLYCGHYW